MESNQREDSSEEVDQPEQDNNRSSNDVARTGRSYECVFCKRGFTTAQALGGHMNIHRKDRARNRPNSNSSSVNLSKHEEIYAGPRFYQPLIPSYPPPYSAAHEAQMPYRTYFPASTSNNDVRSFYENDHHHIINNGLSLGLQFVPAHGEGAETRRQGGREEDEVDLELKL